MLLIHDKKVFVYEVHIYEKEEDTEKEEIHLLVILSAWFVFVFL